MSEEGDSIPSSNERLDKVVEKSANEPDKVLEKIRAYRDVTVTLKLHPIGSAPRLKQSTCVISGSQTFNDVLKYLKKETCNDDVHIYLNNIFEPWDVSAVGDFAKMYGKQEANKNDKPAYSLSAHYSTNGKAYM